MGERKSFKSFPIPILNKPFFLAGTEQQNVEAVVKVPPYAVDLNSGVEAKAQSKDKIRHVVEMRGALDKHPGGEAKMIFVLNSRHQIQN